MVEFKEKVDMDPKGAAGLITGTGGGDEISPNEDVSIDGGFVYRRLELRGSVFGSKSISKGLEVIGSKLSCLFENLSSKILHFN